MRSKFALFLIFIILIIVMIAYLDVKADNLEKDYLPIVVNISYSPTPAPTWNPCWMIPPELGICPPVIPPATPKPTPTYAPTMANPTQKPTPDD